MAVSKNRPDFLLVGAAKSGTSSLYSYLSQHPAIFLPDVKEPNYFAYKESSLQVTGPKSGDLLVRLLLKKTVTSKADYDNLFSEASDGQVTGDCSPRYLYYDHSAEFIYEESPNARIIVVLRDPVARAYSHYLMNRQRDLEPLESFEEAIAEEGIRKENGWGWDWHYLSLGRYHEQLMRYYERFPDERILVILHDELIVDQQAVIKKIYRFIGVDDSYIADTERRFKVASTVGAADSYLGRLVFATESTWLGRMAIKLVPKKAGLWAQNILRDIVSKRKGGRRIPALSLETKSLCWDRLKDDVVKLEKLLDRDLSGWAPANKSKG